MEKTTVVSAEMIENSKSAAQRISEQNAPALDPNADPIAAVIANRNTERANLLNALLRDNRGFAKRTVSASALGTFYFEKWEEAVDRLHYACYDLAQRVYTERGILKHSPTTIEQREVYERLRDVFALLAPVEVDGETVELYKDHVDEQTGMLVVGLSWCMATAKTVTYTAAAKMLSEAKKALKAAKEADEDDDELEKLASDVDIAAEAFKAISETEYQNYEVFTQTEPKVFRKQFEDFLGGMIFGAESMTAEEILAKREAAKAAKEAARKAKREKKKAEEKAKKEAEKAASEAAKKEIEAEANADPEASAKRHKERASKKDEATKKAEEASDKRANSVKA